jgi:hypothetical protein
LNKIAVLLLSYASRANLEKEKWRWFGIGRYARKTFRESAALARDTTIGHDIPLIVVSHDPNLRDSELPAVVDNATNAAWEQVQIELSQLSTHGSRMIATGSGHYI